MRLPRLKSIPFKNPERRCDASKLRRMRIGHTVARMPALSQRPGPHALTRQTQFTWPLGQYLEEPSVGRVETHERDVSQSLSFCAEKGHSMLSGFVDQKPHPRMRRFEIRRDAVPSETVRSQRTY